MANYFMARATVETNVEASDDGLDLYGDVCGSDDENIGEAQREIQGLACKGEANIWEALYLLIFIF